MPKKGIHAEFVATNVKCLTCGATFAVKSNKENINIDICSNCHPFYTGKQRVASADGRIEKFKKKYSMGK